MNNAQRRNESNLERPFPGCLGRMVNLFDLNAGIHSKKLLTDRQRYDDSPFSRSQSDVGMATSSPALRHEMEGNLRTWNVKENGMPMKKPVEEDMAKEAETKDNPPNVVAKLMGLDSFPSHQPCSAIPKIHARECSPCKTEDLAMTRRMIEKEYGFSKKRLQGQMTQIHHRSVQKEYKDWHENWQQSVESDCVRKKSLQIDSNRGTANEKKMSLVRQKFMEAKRLATDEKLRQSKEFQDALEVLSSNRDVFVRFLQEPNSLFSKNLYEFHSLPPSPGTKRITILRPSNVENFKGSSRKSDKTLKKPAQVEQSSSTTIRIQRDDEFTVQPTRIVVLKPSRPKIQDIKNVVSPPSSSPGIVNGESFNKEPENGEADVSRRLAREITQKMRANLMGNQVNDEMFVSSVFSNVSSDNGSSFYKSENVQAFENSSDLEFMSPSSRHSWDYVKRCGGPFSSSSFSRISCSPEWSVSMEAKKRLSERWEMMASHGNAQEQRGLRRNSHTLGDMLALAETKKLVTSEDEDKKPAQIESILSLTCDGKQKYVRDSPTNLMRSKSAPDSSTTGGEESSDARMSKLEEKETDPRSSFKGKVSRLFFPRSKKPSEHATCDVNNDVILSVPRPESRIYGDATKIGNDNGLEGCLSVGLSSSIPSELTKMRHQRGIICQEKGSDNLNTQPRTILVLEPHFDKNDSTMIQESFGYVRPGVQQEVKSIIDKSPPIESIARTLQRDDSCSCASDKSPFQTSSVPTRAEEERNFLLFIQTLLTMAGLESDSFPLRWHSLENPLDPSLRDKYANLDSKEPLYEAKRRELKSYRTLVFDCVTAALLDFTDKGHDWSRQSISNCRSHNTSLEFALPTSDDGVLAKMKEWFDNEARSFVNDEGDSVSRVLESVVRKKVVGKEWVENLRNEGENMGREIEVKLLQELVEEAVSDFADKT